MTRTSPPPPTDFSPHTGAQGCKDIIFPMSLYTNLCKNIDMYITATLKAKEKMVGEIAGGHGGTG
jgi:hypothetical protein